MQASSLLVLAVVAALFVSSTLAVSTISPWQAFWTDSRHGGNIATCVEGTTFWGVYSNVGYLVGNVSADGTTASGSWYEAGHVDGATGSFTWTLSSGQAGFSGIRLTQYVRCAPSTWSETKITTSSPTREDCKRLYDNSQIDLDIRTLSGTYSSGASTSLQLCIFSDGFYEASQFVGSTFSYSTGYVRYGSVIGTGSYTLASNGFVSSSTGIEMLLLADPALTNLGLNSNNGTRLVQYRYAGATDAEDVNVATDTVVQIEWLRSNTDGSSGCSSQRGLLANPWAGAWTDHDFGFGRLYMCVNNGLVRGVYSELGWLDASLTTDGKTIIGRFYDAGDTRQVSGDFSLTLLDPLHFSGNWTFDNSGHRYWWNETRVSVLAPATTQCMQQTATGSTIAGTWRYDVNPTADTLDICFSADGTRFEASYNFNGGVDRGYITGFVREFGTALQGEWHESGLQGILTIFLTGPNSIQMLRWNHGDIQASYYYNCDDESGDILWMRHRNVAFTQRVSTTAKASSCARNADLISFAQAGPFVPNGFTDKYAVSYVAFKQPNKRNVFDFLVGLFSAAEEEDDATSASSPALLPPSRFAAVLVAFIASLIALVVV